MITFFNLCKNMKIIIKKFQIKYQILIIETKDYNFIINQKYKIDKIFHAIIYLYIY